MAHTTIKNLTTRLFHEEPYSPTRYRLSEELEKLENALNIRTNYHNLNVTNHTIECDLLRKDTSGLYETVETFKIDNIKIYERKGD